MLYSFLLQIQKMLGVALPSGIATPTFIIEPILPVFYEYTRNQPAMDDSYMDIRIKLNE